jgi:hypothetical protein
MSSRRSLWSKNHPFASSSLQVRWKIAFLLEIFTLHVFIFSHETSTGFIGHSGRILALAVSGDGIVSLFPFKCGSVEVTVLF